MDGLRACSKGRPTSREPHPVHVRTAVTPCGCFVQ